MTTIDPGGAAVSTRDQLQTWAGRPSMAEAMLAFGITMAVTLSGLWLLSRWFDGLSTVGLVLFVAAVSVILLVVLKALTRCRVRRSETA